MHYVIAGNWAEANEYTQRHGYLKFRFVTDPSQLPPVRKRGDVLHFVGTFETLAKIKSIREHIKERLILDSHSRTE